MTAATCVQEITGDFRRIHDEGVTAISVRVRFSYDAENPYAVTLTFIQASDTEWVVARELIDAGITASPAGVGDVVIYTFSRSGQDVTAVVLKGEAEVTFSTAEIIDFLQETEDIVPYNLESQHFRPEWWPWQDDEPEERTSHAPARRRRRRRTRGRFHRASRRPPR